jgi:amidase
MPLFPPTIAEAADAASTLRLTALVRPFNLSGHPALSIPIEAPEGLPIGLQLIGRIGEDAALTAVARALVETLEINPRLSLQEHVA